MELWIECIKGNKKAWEEMEKYNKMDILCLEDVYKKLQPWGDGVSFNPYRGGAVYLCNCGSNNLVKDGFKISRTGKHQRYRCQSCGRVHQATGAKNNLFSDGKKLSLKGPRGG
jgi:hypothetical protein